MLCSGCFEKKSGESECQSCGYDERLKRSPLILPHQTMLGQSRYLVGRVLGRPGGFGITYLGWDQRLQTKVAIKEFLPRDLSGRDTDHQTVVPHSGEDAENFEYGLSKFLEEGRTLAQLNHPNIVRVRDYFEENGTAYLVMDYCSGLTLSEYLAQQQSRIITEEIAVGIIMPVLDGLREVHAKGFLHRDIKPQNIYLTTQGIPILLDFGAARQCIGERSGSLSVMLSEGYAPIEQYQRNSRQGQWTDVYGAAASIYCMVCGTHPPVAIERIGSSKEVDFPNTELTASFKNTIAKALAVDPLLRIQSIEEFQGSLLKKSRTVHEDGPVSSLQLSAITNGKQPAHRLGALATTKPIYALVGFFVAIMIMWPLMKFSKEGDSTKNIQPRYQPQVEAINTQSLQETQIKQEQDRAEGYSVAESTEVAIVGLKQVAQAGDVSTQVKLGIIYDEGIGVQANPSEAVTWYRMAAERSDPEAQNRLGVMYSKGKGVEPNVNEQVKWFTKAATGGHLKGQYNLGKLYARGIGVKQNNSLAASWYTKSADQGYDKAQYYLGTMLFEGAKRIKKNTSRGLELITKSANQGNLDGQFYLALINEQGKAVIKDYQQAAFWYRKAAESGDRRAQNNLATLYSRGWGVPQDEAAQVYWYRKSAEQGYPKAQNSMGVIFENGIGVPADYHEALRWYTLAAEQGYAKAQYNLGNLYKTGKGVLKDVGLANHWLEMASAQGYSKAAESLLDASTIQEGE